MGMFDEVSVYQSCPKCEQWVRLNLQTKDLACQMDNYTPLPNDWFTNQEESIGGQKKFRERMLVFPKFPKDKEHTVWKSQAERREAAATLEEPYANQLKFVNFYGSCPNCNSRLDGKIKVEDGMLIGHLFDVLVVTLVEVKST